QSRGVRRSSPLPIDVETMANGDLDADGTNDLVVASRNQIRVFHFSDERFQQVAAFDFPPVIKIHVVNIGDPDQSGLPRLFVSANNGWQAASAILGWDGSATLQLLQQNLDWYIRPVVWPDRGEILAGQQASQDEAVRFLAPGVYQLSLDPDSGRLERGGQLLLPPGSNLFDFAIADFNGDGRNETAVIDERHRLLVYDEAQSPIWVSSASYGGSLRHFGPILTDEVESTVVSSTHEEGTRQLVYIPGRMDAKDISGDGLPELIIVTNEVDIVSTYLPNLRSYDGGSVACLGWRGAGLAELWRTNHIAGYVADYVFADSAESEQVTEGDPLSRLYVAQLPDKALWRRFLPGGDNSRILAYEMRVVPQ
ncbi:MAG: VCBS repeat-containing protein, partial [Desulfofustis sp.]|nr:VCBS repeat-containing protein [Desulfofustis sp.]